MRDELLEEMVGTVIVRAIGIVTGLRARGAVLEAENIVPIRTDEFPVAPHEFAAEPRTSAA